MKNKSNTKSSFYVNSLSFIVALPICAVIYLLMRVIFPTLRYSLTRIIFPTLRFTAKVAFKLLRKGLTRSKVVMQSPQLPTPDIFKDAPNLAPAKSVRF